MLIWCAILFQSCVLYQKAPVSLLEAAEPGSQTKITGSNQDTFKYGHVLRGDEAYYGVKIKGGKAIQTPLSEEEIMEIRIRNNSASNWANVSVGILGAFPEGSALFGADITTFGREVK